MVTPLSQTSGDAVSCQERLPPVLPHRERDRPPVHPASGPGSFRCGRTRIPCGPACRRHARQVCRGACGLQHEDGGQPARGPRNSAAVPVRCPSTTWPCWISAGTLADHRRLDRDVDLGLVLSRASHRWATGDRRQLSAALFRIAPSALRIATTEHPDDSIARSLDSKAFRSAVRPMLSRDADRIRLSMSTSACAVAAL